MCLIWSSSIGGQNHYWEVCNFRQTSIIHMYAYRLMQIPSLASIYHMQYLLFSKPKKVCKMATSSKIHNDVTFAANPCLCNLWVYSYICLGAGFNANSSETKRSSLRVLTSNSLIVLLTALLYAYWNLLWSTLYMSANSMDKTWCQTSYIFQATKRFLRNGITFSWTNIYTFSHWELMRYRGMLW